MQILAIYAEKLRNVVKSGSLWAEELLNYVACMFRPYLTFPPEDLNNMDIREIFFTKNKKGLQFVIRAVA